MIELTIVKKNYEHKRVYKSGTDHPNGVSYEIQDEYFGQ